MTTPFRSSTTRASVFSPSVSAPVKMALEQDAIQREKLTRAYRAAATGDLTLTTSFQDVPGCTVTLADPGTYLIVGDFDYVMSAAGTTTALGQLDVSGVAEAAQARAGFTAELTLGVSRAWLVRTTQAGRVAKLRASKSLNAGTVAAKQTHTVISAHRIS